MTKRETAVRYINVLIVLSFILIYIKSNIFLNPGFYISTLYIIFMILKPFMLKHPLSSPANFITEFFDELFVIGISIFVTEDAFLPLSMLSLLRCSLLFPIYFVILAYIEAILFTVFTSIASSTIELHNLFLLLLVLVIPSCIVCIVKNDVIIIHKQNNDLNEKLRIKNTVIDELQKYSDVLYVGGHKKEEDMLRTDYVSQIPNRYFFEEMLSSGIKKSIEPTFNMGLMLVYVDNLYQYRLEYGYATEHILIKRIHDLIAAQIKSNDFVARYEEDCIGVLLFNKDLEHAENLAEILNTNFEIMKIDEPELEDITLRIGVNDIEHSMKDDKISVDTIKLLNQCHFIDFEASLSGFNNNLIHKNSINASESEDYQEQYDDNSIN